MTITVASTVATGTYTITVTGTSGAPDTYGHGFSNGDRRRQVAISPFLHRPVRSR